MDSLRYWVLEMHVDGFRFDLAAALARQFHEVHRLAPFFDLVQQDPVISQVKLIAEPWDLGEGGYQVGNFPPLWSEWNGRYRDAIRDYWRGVDRSLPEFAYRFTGSSDLYGSTGRRPHASINFVTSHDGFTLADLVSYDSKHNEANGEGQPGRHQRQPLLELRCGGTHRGPRGRSLRRRQQRNLLVTLLLSQGVPMLSGGDELGRTQAGNNNAYCQDNELSWFDWYHVDASLLAFTQALVRFRRDHPAFRRRRYFQGRPIRGNELSDIGWSRPDGAEMSDEDWRVGFAKSLGVFLNGHAIPDPGPHNEPVRDDSFYLLCNADAGPVSFVLPWARWGELWAETLSTATEAPPSSLPLKAGERVDVPGRALIVLRRL